MATKNATPSSGAVYGAGPAEQLSLEFAAEGDPPASEPRHADEPPLQRKTEAESTGRAIPAHVATAEPEPPTLEAWRDEVTDRLRDQEDALDLASRGIECYPADPLLLTQASFAAVAQDRPEIALRYIKRFTKRFHPNEEIWTCHAIALAQSNRWAEAQAIVRHRRLGSPAKGHYAPPGIDARWIGHWIMMIRLWSEERDAVRVSREEARGRRQAKPKARHAPALKATAVRAAIPPSVAAGLEPLPRSAPHVSLTVDPMDEGQFAILGGGDLGSPEDFVLRHEVARLSLLKGYDELLCFPHLQELHHYPYQIETVRKVLKHFRGRVLLADEVGLGKTIEAGMVLKEYDLRGMVDRVLILTPASLVGQWREEMSTKFGLSFTTSQDAAARRNPEGFWSGRRIIASIATARMEHHMIELLKQPFDLVIVDEAHHLVNRASKNWKLVDRLKTRFLLLLSATPVQNRLIELYNLLTLLKPGLFKTEKDFRASYVTPGKPRVPVNRERLQLLMRDVMVRNTRALANVALPPRQALTVRIEPSPEEAACYHELSTVLRDPRMQGPRHRLALSQLLQAAGSSPLAARKTLRRLAGTSVRSPWRRVSEAYNALATHAKARALLDLLARNPGEKTLVFVRFLETQRYLERLLRDGGFQFACFDGRLSGAEKDAAIERFRDYVPVLLSTESGGEGRNIQFCHTLINYDLPWNPQAIEQRIGRLHRIGQEHEVFVFSLATQDTVEERVLAILDEKIGMFELVVGEIQAILGGMDDDADFASQVFDAWIRESNDQREEAFDALAGRLTEARTQYETAKALDSELFGDGFEAI